MSTGVRAQLHHAEPAALELRAMLSGGCARIEVGGSIRRRLTEVHDIELVAVPIVTLESDGFFGTREVDQLQVALDAAIRDGVLEPHPLDPKRGPRYSKLQHAATGLQVDVFSARPETFGLIYLIRTGPAGFSRRLMTDARRAGYHVAGGELHTGAGDCYRPEYCETVPTPEEADVARYLRLEMLPVPEQRA